MTGTFARIAAIVLAACPIAALAAADPHVFDKAAYADAIARARDGATPAPDYRWLRQQRANRDLYVESHWAEFKTADGLIDTDPARAVEMARARMVDNWTELLPHLVARVALKKLGREDDANRETGVIHAIMDSIVDGRHGSSAEDAFNATTSGEEYPVLMLLGLKMQRQALVPKDGHTYDVMTATDRNGGSHDIWFNIDFFFGREGGMDQLLKH